MTDEGRGPTVMVVDDMPDNLRLLRDLLEGEGFRVRALPRLFEPFYTSKPVGEGTGLGLSITHGIVKEHGGKITAANEPDGGTHFTVHLPVGESLDRREECV